MKSRRLLLTLGLVLLVTWLFLTPGGLTFGSPSGGIFGWRWLGFGHGMMGGGMGHGMMDGWTTDVPVAPVTPDSGAAADVEVELQNVRFNPNRVEIRSGETVRFTNRDGFAHNVIQATPENLQEGDSLFQSPTLGAGESWSYTFKEAGTYPILCTVGGHYRAGMVGEVVVLAAE